MTPVSAAWMAAQRTTVAGMAVLVWTFAATTALAQTSTGGIRGFVKDETGAFLAGATVEAVSPARIGPPAVGTSDHQGL